MPEQIPNTNDLDDSFENWDGSEIRKCSDLVYKLTLNNTQDQKIM